MKSKSKDWRVHDRYTNPGPIQFHLNEAINERIAITLSTMFEQSDDMAE